MEDDQSINSITPQVLSNENTRNDVNNEEYNRWKIDRYILSSNIYRNIYTLIFWGQTILLLVEYCHLSTVTNPSNDTSNSAILFSAPYYILNILAFALGFIYTILLQCVVLHGSNNLNTDVENKSSVVKSSFFSSLCDILKYRHQLFLTTYLITIQMSFGLELIYRSTYDSCDHIRGLSLFCNNPKVLPFYMAVVLVTFPIVLQVTRIENRFGTILICTIIAELSIGICLLKSRYFQIIELVPIPILFYFLAVGHEAGVKRLFLSSTMLVSILRAHSKDLSHLPKHLANSINLLADTIDLHKSLATKHPLPIEEDEFEVQPEDSIFEDDLFESVSSLTSADDCMMDIDDL